MGWAAAIAEISQSRRVSEVSDLILESVPQGDLNDARTVSTEDSAKVGVVQSVDGVVQVHSIQEVEEFTTEGEPMIFLDLEVLHDDGIPVEGARAIEEIAPCCSYRSSGRERKSACVEVLLDPL